MNTCKNDAATIQHALSSAADRREANARAAAAVGRGEKLIAAQQAKQRASAHLQDLVRGEIREAVGTDVDRAWELIESIGREALRCASPRDSIRRAMGQAFWNRMACGHRSMPGVESWSLQLWRSLVEDYVSFVAIKRSLSKHLWEMPDVEKGDDGFGDWCDALPLAGKALYTEIVGGGLQTYREIARDLQARGDADATYKLTEAELYVEMTWEEVLIDKLGGVSAILQDRQNVAQAKEDRGY